MATAADALPFTAPWLLAPMDGVTDPVFRRCVLELHAPEHLGGTFTEFVRVVDQPVPLWVLKRDLGELRPGDPRPVGLQLMANKPDPLAATAIRAVEAGARVVDLNFGCPARGVMRGCAGAALLQDPAQVERLVAASVRALQGVVPLTAKIRAGYGDDSQLEDLVRAVCDGGASMLTVHCRTASEGYAPEAPWSRLERAAATSTIPVCGNGGIDEHADLERLRRETGCALAMVGRASLANPWIFSGEAVDGEAAVRFAWTYYERMEQRGARKGAVGRMKQLFRRYAVGGVIADEDDRLSWLRERDADRFVGRLAALRDQLPEAATASRGGTSPANKASTRS